MTLSNASKPFKATLARPASPGNEGDWAFVVLPKHISKRLPRRGRTTVAGAINGHPFQAMVEPDGQLSHWLRLDKALYEAAGAKFGAKVTLEIAPLTPEPEPEVPDDFAAALQAVPGARAVWTDTTTLARVDWIHWITSAKQAKTRAKRISDACDMLASGERRVCCFDPSGFYSKALRAPKPAAA